MPDQDNSQFGDRFRKMIETIDVANLLTEPLTTSINSLLLSSASEISSREASVLVRGYHGKQLDVQTKGGDEPVTEADHAASALIVITARPFTTTANAAMS